MWDDPRQMNALSATLGLLALAGLVIAIVAYVVRLPAFAFREVVVTTPLARADSAQLEAAIRDDLAGTFFTMDLARARVMLARVPWVRDVALRRQWPNRLEIAVDEHEPLARFNDGQFVSARGEVFAAGSDVALPSFEGPEARAAEMADRYREWSQALAPLALRVVEMRLSPRGGWRLKAAGADSALTLELGRDEPDARLARFVAAYRQTLGALARAGTRVEVVDLRYRNGFAARIPAFRERAAKPAA
ncbi:MAG: cell division protein FtsQ/DivIB [Burkholderiales bacterium]|nr:cell division protein FtsQ/DivIB [Burkholderiales bacterium]